MDVGVDFSFINEIPCHYIEDYMQKSLEPPVLIKSKSSILPSIGTDIHCDSNCHLLFFHSGGIDP